MMEREKLQRMWDRMLLTAFLRQWYSEQRISPNMHRMAFCFEAMTGTSLDAIKRAPLDFHQRTMGPVRFVCGHLPRLARILIDNAKTEEDIPDLVEKLQRWHIDTVMRDPQERQQTSELVKQRRAYRAAELARKAEMEFKDLSNATQHLAGHRRPIVGAHI